MFLSSEGTHTASYYFVLKYKPSPLFPCALKEAGVCFSEVTFVGNKWNMEIIEQELSQKIYLFTS